MTNPAPDDETRHVVDAVVDDDRLAAWQRALPAQREARWSLLATLAWHLRQRDTGRALRLCDEAQALLDDATLRPAEIAALARLALVRGEARLLFADFGAAQGFADAALAGFTRAGDAAGCCDAHWLAAAIAADQGRLDRRDAALARAGADAVACADPLRIALTQALTAYQAVVADSACAPQWEAAMQAQLATGRPQLAIWANDFRVALAFERGDHGRAIAWLHEEMDAAGRCGLVRKSISTAANLALAFSRLNDHGTALEHARRSLALARATGWPVSIGPGLVQTANILDCLHQPAAAQAMLGEALELLRPLAGSFPYLPALCFEGEFALRRGDAAAALQAFATLEERARGPNASQFVIPMHLGRARALALAGRGEPARASAERALAEAVEHGNADARVEALQVLADLHDRFALAPPPGQCAAGAALHYLEQALAVAAAIPGFTVPDHLLMRLAEQHAKAGDAARTYALAREAAAAREATHGREVRDRAMATRLSHEAERARAQSEHHRRLADVEARRSAALESTLADLRVAQAELLRRNALQARMNAEREETLAFLAHDLRVPLTGIVSTLSDPADARGLERSLRFAARALAMTDRFLEVARLSHLVPAARVVLDLAAVVDEACETFERRAVAQGRALEFDLSFGIAVLGHREALTRAVCNLVDNALRFAPAGGRVDVRMAVAGEEVGVIVGDDGPGLPTHALRLLAGDGAEPGASPDGRFGLAIVARVAAVHEARIDVASSAAGTRIALWFRRATPSLP